jgi:predicted transcriptional regulator
MSLEKWKEICFILSKSVSPKMSEKDFENQVVRAVEALGWKEFKNEIKRQPVLKIGHGKKLQPDLAVYDDSDEPIIAIEVKRPAEDLTKDDVSSQLHSYMRQLKAEFGFAIGGTIRFFYDGPLYSQKEPVLLCDIVFDEDSTDGQELVSNINSESVAQRKHLPYLNKLINKVKEKRSISKLRRVLLTKETKENILAYLRAEFIDYGSEIVEGALNSIDIQLNRKDIVRPPKTKRKTEPAPTTVKGKILNAIQTSQSGISKKEICSKLNLSSKQVANAIYRLKRGGHIESNSRGVWVATYSPRSKKLKIKPSKPKRKNVNIREEVLKTITRYKNGARFSKIVERTGFEKKQVRNALHSLKKQGKIISIEFGLYKAV